MNECALAATQRTWFVFWCTRSCCTRGLRVGCGWAAGGLRVGCGWAAGGLWVGCANVTHVNSPYQLGLCRLQQKKLEAAITEAWDYGIWISALLFTCTHVEVALLG